MEVVQIISQIKALQDIQKVNPPGSDASVLASQKLAPLFDEMRKRQKAGFTDDERELVIAAFGGAA